MMTVLDIHPNRVYQNGHGDRIAVHKVFREDGWPDAVATTNGSFTLQAFAEWAAREAGSDAAT